ncbi:hypothetical protein IC620_01825 [Hazenella sp. IB182357]|uniref:Uncharacterized protein n=1 Tax=Polycladospora coralii TaxID=2771432 RepID=A0A926N898_9BACL|nr:hypothetical protein [Polycladospora coralii]MBD1371097.1 hypothetical protein [Polycladospora coralii]MBS7530039.1 hypothetical protein [Polycladospora coralii]
MEIELLEGDQADQLRVYCYLYLLEKMKEECFTDDRDLCKSEYGRTSQERV